MTALLLASLVLNYDNLSDANYLFKLGVILSATKDSDLFRPYPPHGSPEKLEELRDQFKVAYEGALDRSHRMIELRKATRKESDAVLHAMGHHIESHCQGDLKLLGQSGFDVRHPRTVNTHRTIPTPSAPMTFVVEPGDRAGQLKFKLVATRLAAFCEIWYTDGDPSIEANWKYKAGFAEFEGVLDDMESGTRYSLRARFVGKGGPSDWSNTITVLVE